MKIVGDVMREFVDLPDNRQRMEERKKYVLSYPGVREFLVAHQEEITQDILFNSMSKLNEFVQEDEALKKGKQNKKMGFAPYLFFNQGYIDVGYRPTQAYLKQVKKRKQESLLDNRMMSRDVRQAQITSIDISNMNRRRIMAEITDKINQLREDIHQVKGLYLFGPFGVGKTYILGAVANLLTADGLSVTMIHYPTFAQEMKASIATNSVLTNLNKVKEADVLIIDDIGAEANSAWLRDEVLTVILEYRMKEQLPTFFTSNFSMANLEQHFQETRDVTETVKAQRLMERVRYLAKEVFLDGENLRQKER